MVREKRTEWTGKMARSKRKRSSKTLRNFYLNGDLHRTLLVNRPEDMLIAWNFTQNRRVAYVLSDARQHMQRAYSVAEVAKIFDRQKKSIFRYIYNGNIPPPQKSYVIGEPEKQSKYYFSEEDIYRLHDFLLTVNAGRPRLDGLRTPTRAPSRRELEAILRNDTILYVKNDNGEFLPVWKQPDW